MKEMQHHVDREEREFIRQDQQREIEEKRLAKETRTVETRRLMDNNLHEL